MIFLRSIRCGVLRSIFTPIHSYVAVGQPPSPVLLGCYTTQGSVILFGIMLLLLFYELGAYPHPKPAYILMPSLVVMSMTLWIGVRELRHSLSPVVKGLYRGCIFYCIFLSREFFSSENNTLMNLNYSCSYLRCQRCCFACWPSTSHAHCHISSYLQSMSFTS